MIAENRVKRANAVVVAVDAVTASTRDLWVSVSFVRAALVWVSKVEVEAVVANVVVAVVVSSAAVPIVVAGICTPCFRIPF